MTPEQLKAAKFALESEIAKLHNNQMARKIFINSEYGALANKYFRYYDIRLASAITLSGQLALRWMEDYLMAHPLQRKYGWRVIYEDTDSLYVCLDRLALAMLERFKDPHKVVDKLNEFSTKVVQPIIDRGYEELATYVNANENRMFMKQEKISSKAMWTGKKKYALLVYDNEGVRYDEPELKVKGIETVRSSTPKIVRKKLKKVLKLILTDPGSLPGFIEDARAEFMASEPEDLAFTVSVNTLNKYEDVVYDQANLFEEEFREDYDEYELVESELGYKKKSPIGVRAALIHNNYVIKNDLYNVFTEIYVGEKIKWLYMRQPNPLHENILGFRRLMPDRDKLRQYVDYPLQFYKTFIRPIENITKKIGMPLTTVREVPLDSIFGETPATHDYVGERPSVHGVAREELTVDDLF